MGMTSGGGTGSGSELNSEINVTPMVDIMLVLLIIFMVVTPLLQSGVTVTLPRGKNPDEDGNITKDTAVVISIPWEGAYYVGRDQVPKERLITTIENRMSVLKPADQIVYIKAGVNVNYGEVVDIINFIRDAKFDRIGLVAEKLKEQ